VQKRILKRRDVLLESWPIGQFPYSRRVLPSPTILPGERDRVSIEVVAMRLFREKVKLLMSDCQTVLNWIGSWVAFPPNNLVAHNPAIFLHGNSKALRD